MLFGQPVLALAERQFQCPGQPLARFLPAAVGLADVHVHVVVDDLAESVPPPPP